MPIVGGCRRLWSRRAVRALSLAGAVALAVLTTTVAASGHGTNLRFGEPPPGRLFLGVVGPDPAGFDGLTGKHHALHVMFAEWRGDVAGLVRTEHDEGRLPVLSLPPSLTPADVARGAEDERYLTLSRALNGSGVDVWVRIAPEMNGAWNPWCAFDASGRSRGPKYAPSQFVQAFRRISVILRGGSAAAINAKLRAAGEVPLRSGGSVDASGKVAIIWNPQGHGTPYIDANGPAPYWPGRAYVDIVADDLYSDSGEPSWQGMDTLYAYRLPFLVAEWGLKGEDNVSFARRMFSWVPTHPRTIGLVYFNKGWSGGSDIFELGSKPRSLAVYRQAIRSPRFLAALPPQ